MRMRLLALVIAAAVMALGSLTGCTGTPSFTEASPSSPSIKVIENIDVPESPQMTTSLMINVLEDVGVGDSPGMLLPVAIKVTESIGVADSHSQNIKQRLAPPTIISFTADPDHIFRGSTSILDWNVTGATTVTIDHDIGTVASSGRKVVTPYNTTTYTLTATNAAGSVYATVTVTVTILRFQ